MAFALRGDDVQEFDTKWDEVLLSMKNTLGEDMMESFVKLRIRNSEQVKTTSALYNQDTLEKGQPVSFTRLKNMVKKYLE